MKLQMKQPDWQVLGQIALVLIMVFLLIYGLYKTFTLTL